MARYTGPVNKKSRRYRYSSLETNKEFLKGKKRTTVPGEHGDKYQKLSNYGEHLYEKQKLKYIYGISEKQMQKIFKRATKMEGVLGENILFILESRLDNIVYRSGIAKTRRQARQIINHGHVIVNGRKIDIPSYQVKVGDTFTFKDRIKNNKLLQDNLNNRRKSLFVEFDPKTLQGKFVRLPERDEIAGQINESLIVEYYNK